MCATSSMSRSRSGFKRDGESQTHLQLVAWMKGTSWSVETTVFVITLTVSTSSSSAREWHSLLNVCLYGVINSSVITQPPLRLHIAAALSLWNRTRCRNALILCFFYSQNVASYSSNSCLWLKRFIPDIAHSFMIFMRWRRKKIMQIKTQLFLVTYSFLRKI